MSGYLISKNILVKSIEPNTNNVPDRCRNLTNDFFELLKFTATHLPKSLLEHRL